MLHMFAAWTSLQYVSRYHTQSQMPLTWSLLIVGGFALVTIVVFCVFWFVVPGGRDQVKGFVRQGRFFSGPRFGGQSDTYMGAAALEPLSKPKGLNDCPQCGDPVGPGVTKCPHCGWNLHARQADPAAATQGFIPVAVAPIAGSVEVAKAPVNTSAADLTVPAAPVEDASARVGIIQHDIVIGGVLAFTNGERVRIEDESPDPARPDYKYVVTSSALDRKFRLSDLDIFT